MDQRKVSVSQNGELCLGEKSAKPMSAVCEHWKVNDSRIAKKVEVRPGNMTTTRLNKSFWMECPVDDISS